MMFHARIASLLLTILFYTCAAFGALPDLPNAPVQAFGIVKGRDLNGREVFAADDGQAKLAADAQFAPANASQALVDRSLELVDRQTCSPGYGYCSAFGKCCPSSDLCCSYGYCIDPARTCCPGGSCRPGWGCCGTNNCYPSGGDCCSNGNYCEPGNICVRLVSSNRIVCCTDLQCTARVVSGVTSTLSAAQTTTRLFTTSAPRPTTTRTTTTFLEYETWYWTVTWWYVSFYWSTIRRTSSVTYTTVYATTTLTTTATDEDAARSYFSDLSSTLTFPVPAEARTSLAAFLTSTEIPSPTFVDESSTESESSSSTPSSSSSSSFSSTASQPTFEPTVIAGGPGAGTASNGKWLGGGMLGLALMCGVLMIWL